MRDPKDVEHQRNLLRIYRRNLAHYLERLARVGGPAHATPEVMNGIDEQHNGIKRVKQILRDWGEQIEDDPNDPPSSSSGASASSSQQPAAGVAATATTPPGSADQPHDSGFGSYDVFISYSHRNRAWVQGDLLPRLEGAGLRVCIDYRDFEIGVPSLINMENAVDNSRHTLLVLTPEWVESQWTEFESLLVGTGDPAGRQRKLIPLLLVDCKIPPRIAILSYADLRQPEGRANELDRLIRQLKRLIAAAGSSSSKDPSAT